jgi:hypothetical protein
MARLDGSAREFFARQFFSQEILDAGSRGARIRSRSFRRWHVESLYS